MYVPCIDCRLRHRPCFRPFSDEELKSISSLKTNHLAVAAKTDIVTEGEVGGSLYTLSEHLAPPLNATKLVRYLRLELRSLVLIEPTRAT